MYKKIFLIILISILIIGCKKIDGQKSYNEIDAGKVISAHVIPTSFNESTKMQIETTKGIYLIHRLLSITKGELAFIRQKSNGSKFLCLESYNYCPRIY